MDISIIITCYNEEKNIIKCLQSLLCQDYKGNYEIIVVDGNSNDNTQPNVKELTGVNKNIRLIVEPKKGTAAGRNTGVRVSHYDYIAFMDADCEAPENWLSILAENYKEAKVRCPEVIGVGGRNIIPNNAGSFLKGLSIALDSYLGSFNSIQGRQFNAPRFVLSLSTSNALYKKDKIIEIGYFDETLYSEAEDAEINYRLSQRGYRFLFIPDSFVWHKMRATVFLWLKNMFRYGKGRARLLKRYPSMWNISFILPIFFILSLALVPFGIYFRLFFVPLLYIPFVLIISFYQCKRKDSLTLTLIVMYIYMLQHIGYASGEIYGLINPRIK